MVFASRPTAFENLCTVNEQPWILGISASHNGSACLLKGDEIVVAIQEERLTRFKRHRIYGARPSLAVRYCLNYAGIEPDDLSLVVLCIQGRASDEIHDVRRDPFLNVVLHSTPTITIPHHYGHAVSVFATSGFAESAILIVDGTGSPVTDFTLEEQKLLNGGRPDSWETISLYYASETNIVPLEKHVVERGAWLVMHDSEMPSFGSLGGMFSAAAQQIFGEPAEAGKVMGLAPYGRPEFPSRDFFEIANEKFCFKDNVPLSFATTSAGRIGRANTKRSRARCKLLWRMRCCTWSSTSANYVAAIICVTPVESH